MRELMEHVAPPPRADVAESDAPPLPAGGFLQRPWVQGVLPFATSLATHAALIAIGIAAAGVIIARPPEPLGEQQVGSGQTDLRVTLDTSSLQSGDATAHKPIVQDVDPVNATAEGLSTVRGKDIEPSIAGGSGADEAGASAIIGGSGAFGPTAGGGGTGNAGGAGNGGPLARFGTPTDGMGLKGLVFGGPPAKRIVFVCDATGTMIQKFAMLRQELAIAVNGLKPVQSYNVVFFHDGERAAAASDAGLMPATPDNKRKGFAFMENFSTSGTTDPMPALRLAFRQNPELIYFLSDGEFNNLRSYQDVIDEVARLNPGRKVKVNTILFDTYDPDAEAAMQKIAAEHGGRYRYVKESDLN